MDLITVLAILAIVLLLYHFIAKKYEYFLSKPVPCVKPTFLFGSSAPHLFRRTDEVSFVTKLYNAFPDAKISGFYDFTTPIYILRDPEIIKRITVKDFDYFTDHTPVIQTSHPEVDSSELTLFENALFLLRGQKWRDMRATLSPAFTGSKMRHMFGLVADCSKSLTAFLREEALNGKQQRLELEMKDICGRFAVDVIGTVAFGVTVESTRDRDSRFYRSGKELLTFFSFKKVCKFLLMRAVPDLMRKLKVDFFDAELIDYFRSMIVDNMRQREQHKIVRNDMIQMLLQVRNNTLQHQEGENDGKDAGFATVEESSIGRASHTRVWTDDELIAQCLIFFFAGYDTVSSAMTFLAYELAINVNVQNRLHEEVLQVQKSLNGAPLSYETLQGMEYLDMVVCEALRKWPPFVVIDRLCTKDYMYDDGEGTPFVIEKDCTVWMLPNAIQNDPKYYPNPYKFDPERFSKENRSKIIPGTYIPFGAGPRNCIGSRLALMEIKSLTYHLLQEFSFEPTEKTQIPVKLARDGLGLQGEKGVWLELKPRVHLS